jgi:uncharacterized protein (TIGR02145 family)
MKKIFTLLISIPFITSTLNAQDAPPYAFSYKAVIIKANGVIVVNKNISLRISILQGSTIGVPVYTETFYPTTNEYGQVDIVIGQGAAGSLSSINWSADKYFLKTEFDPKGGTNYQVLSIAQLLSVPYSLFTGESGNGFASSYSPTEKRPIIDQQGNISIGAAVDPYWKFNVNGLSKFGNVQVNGWLNTGGLGSYGWVNVFPGGTTYGSQINLDPRSLDGGIRYLICALAGNASEGTGKLLIRNDQAVDNTTSFIIDKNGYVGLGNVNPAYKLDVLGSVNFTEGLYKNGVPYTVDYNSLINRPAGNNLGDMLYWNGTNWVVVPVGSEGQILTIKSGIPTWTTVSGASPVTDADGNSYTSVTIGSQVWMVENLKTTKYSDGSPISNLTDNTQWTNTTDGAYCWYENNISNKNTYGALYNFYAINTGKICPTGWHVPSDAEWTTLTTYLGGESIAGGKLKESGTSHWQSPNSGATNETGFTAIPGGHRYYYGIFVDNGIYGDMWTSTEISASAWTRSMDFDKTIVRRENSSFGNGYSVRCVKDN